LVILSDVSVRRPVFTIIVTAALILFGVIGYISLGVDLMPKIEAPYVTITVVYPGADPDVVENRVLEPIEDVTSTISGLKTINSSAVESFGMIFLEFELNVNADRAIQDVRDQIAKIQRDLPTDAEAPIIQKLDVTATPVVSLVLTGPENTGIARLSYVADKKARTKLQQINGVGLIDILGKQEREIHIQVDPTKLSTYHMALADVQQAVAYGNMDIPGGRLTIGNQELLLKTHGEAESLDELRELVIASPQGAPVRLRDVATVEDSTEEARTLAALDGKRALTLSVRKQSDANSVAVAEAIISAVENKKLDLPEGFDLRVVQDSSKFTRQSVEAVITDLILGAILAVLVILLFLRDGRATFISALALPTSVIATFAFMRMLNFTLNNLTLLSLSLSIGMLIDDAIVVIENIYRHIEMGKSPLQAAKEATSEIGLAVMATTLTIVAVFVPVAFMKGIVGRFFYEFGLTVAFAVMVSLFVSFTLTPMGASKLLRHHNPGWMYHFIGRGLEALDSAYRATVGWVLHHRFFAISTGFLTLIAALFLARYIPSEFQPKMDRGELDVAFSMPEGTSIEATYARGEQIRQLFAKNIPEVKLQLVTIGAGSRQKVNEGKVFVKMPSMKQRKRGQEEIASAMRELIAKHFPKEDISVNQVSFGGAGDYMTKPLSIQLRGDDSVELRTTAQKLVESLKKHPTIVDLVISDRGSRPQYGFQIDRDKVSAAGLSPAQVAMTVRTAIQGTETSQFRDGAERYKVIVKAPESYKTSRQAVLTIPLRGPAGNLVELGELVTPTTEDAAAQIDRQDRVRQVSIQGNLQGIALGPAQEIVSREAQTIVPKTIKMKFSGQGQIMKESFDSMTQALILAIIMIFMVLAAQFESFLHPFTIMMSLPLSVIGAFGALLLTRQTLSMISFIGLIMLMGLVTKNAILLVDQANQRRAGGLAVREALIEAGAVRLRPILMTSFAMIFGMFPVAFGIGEGSEIRRPMGIAVIGGLITSTFLTLLVVPAIYSSFESARNLLKRSKGKVTPAT
jgi:HAE1 family hydrophobic/amphiphilic exporter-1